MKVTIYPNPLTFIGLKNGKVCAVTYRDLISHEPRFEYDLSEEGDVKVKATIRFEYSSAEVKEYRPDE